jgi:hypothetical protein
VTCPAGRAASWPGSGWRGRSRSGRCWASPGWLASGASRPSSSPRLRAATERNLQAAGYEWTGVLLKPDALSTQSAVEFKAPERKKLMDQGYTIIVNMGDQMSDLEGGFAERTYKLPNPFYFVP